MASGYGLSGGPSRCFPFWQEVLACYVVNTNGDEGSGKHKCLPVLEDYNECLHHRKEKARAAAIQAAWRKSLAERPREEAPTAGEVRSLGLIPGPPEEKNLKPAKFIPRIKGDGTAF